MEREARLVGDGTPFGALVAAIRDLRRPKHDEVDPVPGDVRIGGKTCLVTGANSGLGKAAAVELARRGGSVLLACRPRHGGCRDDVARLSGSSAVEMMEVDLADPRFRASPVRPAEGARHPPRRRADECRPDAAESQEVGPGIRDDVCRSFPVLARDDRPMGAGRGDPPVGPGRRDSADRLRHVRSAPLLPCRRFRPSGGVHGLPDEGESEVLRHQQAVALHVRDRVVAPPEPGQRGRGSWCTLCAPAGIASNIARDAPALLKPIVDPLMRHFLQSPEEAVGPAIYLCCAEEAGRATGIYLHLMQRKSVLPAAADPENGARLWAASEDLVAKSRERRERSDDRVGTRREASGGMTMPTHESSYRAGPDRRAGRHGLARSDRGRKLRRVEPVHARGPERTSQSALPRACW